MPIGRLTRKSLFALSVAVTIWSVLLTGARAVDRDEALTIYEDIALARAVEAGWTGSVRNCQIGSESQDSLDATLTAINGLRRMVAIQPVVLDAGRNRKALAAALMMRAQGDLSHYPGPNWRCYSEEGADGARSSNLFLGSSGASAMVGYVDDSGVESLGHRHWLLNPGATRMGTGSTGYTNALSVVGNGEDWSSVPDPKVVAWPPAGSVPKPWIFDDWSIQIGNERAELRGSPSLEVRLGGQLVATSRLIPNDHYSQAGGYKWTIPSIDKGLPRGELTFDVSLTGLELRANQSARWQSLPISYRVQAFDPPKDAWTYAWLERDQICVGSDSSVPVEVTATRASTGEVGFSKSLTPRTGNEACAKFDAGPGYWRLCWNQPGNERFLPSGECANEVLRGRPQVSLSRARSGGRLAMKLTARGAVVGQEVTVRRVVYKRKRWFWKRVGAVKVWRTTLENYSVFPTPFLSNQTRRRASFSVKIARFESGGIPFSALGRYISIRRCC